MVECLQCFNSFSPILVRVWGVGGGLGIIYQSQVFIRTSRTAPVHEVYLASLQGYHFAERGDFFLLHDKCRSNILEKEKSGSEVVNHHLHWLLYSRIRPYRHVFYRAYREKPVISRERNVLMSALHSYSLIFFLHCFHSSKHFYGS